MAQRAEQGAAATSQVRVRGRAARKQATLEREMREQEMASVKPDRIRGDGRTTC